MSITKLHEAQRLSLVIKKKKNRERLIGYYLKAHHIMTASQLFDNEDCRPDLCYCSLKRVLLANLNTDIWLNVSVHALCV